MTIYVHFIDKTKTPERLHNVASVEDNGPRSVRVRMLFSDAKPEFTGVSNVAIQPDREP